jgi:translation initiation factor 4A
MDYNNMNYEIIKYENWNNFNLKDDLLRGIYSYGFENPSNIQQIAIKPALDKRDLIAQAQSGSGKTGTFTISILELININVNQTQAVVVAPTRELATQISNVFSNIGSFMKNLKIKTLVGGSPIQKDISYLKYKKPHVIIGCIGRINDMVNRKLLHIDDLKILCLDEADELLSNTFRIHMQQLITNINKSTQILIYSATMSNEIINLTNLFMNDPVKIIVEKEKLSLECIEQMFIPLNSDMHKYEMLKYIFEKVSITQCIIYVNDINRVQELTDAMNKDGFPVCCIHGSCERTERDNILQDFRNGKFRVLISSNITARGIDIQQIGIVINFDVPKNVNTYLHRIGRSGRWGRKGMAINFVTRYDVHHMKKIENHYKISITELNPNVNIEL